MLRIPVMYTILAITTTTSVIAIHHKLKEFIPEKPKYSIVEFPDEYVKCGDVLCRVARTKDKFYAEMPNGLVGVTRIELLGGGKATNGVEAYYWEPFMDCRPDLIEHHQSKTSVGLDEKNMKKYLLLKEVEEKLGEKLN